MENNVTNWRYKKVQYVEDAKFKCIPLGMAKGIHFKTPLQSMESLQLIKKTAGKFTLGG